MSDNVDKPRVLTQITLLPQALALLEPVAQLVVGPVSNTAAWYAEGATYDAMIVGGNTVIDGPLLDRIGPRLRLLARPGIGVDKIDIAAMTTRGIMLINTPDGPTESTAEHAIALMLN